MKTGPLPDSTLDELDALYSPSMPDPEPLPEGPPPVDELDSDIIPEPIRGWVMDVSDRMQIPPDYVAAATVVGVGSLVGRRVGIHPKKMDDWLVVPNLWGAIVGRPAMMKSPAIAEAMRPLNRLIAKANKEYQEAIKQYEIDVEIAAGRKAAIKEEIRKAAKIDDEVAINELRTKLVEAPDKPTLRRYRTDDPTVEKLGEILLENPNGILVYRDELSGWLHNLEKQGREGDRGFYLESWNGTGSYTVDRIGRGTLHIPALCLSVFGGIQPGPLSSYVYAANKGRAGDDGLLQRFQGLVWPDAPSSWKNIDRWPNSAARDRVCALFERLDEMRFDHLRSEDDRLPAIRFSQDAQAMFDQWRYDLETSLRGDEIASPALEAHLAKYRSLMPSVALIFHLIALADGITSSSDVSKEHAAMAAAWCQYLETHARRLYSSAEHPAMASARELTRHIQRGDLPDEFSSRDVYRKGWSRLSAPDEVNDALGILEEFNHVTVSCVPTDGRDKTVIRVNRKLRAKA